MSPKSLDTMFPGVTCHPISGVINALTFQRKSLFSASRGGRREEPFRLAEPPEEREYVELCPAGDIAVSR